MRLFFTSAFLLLSILTPAKARDFLGPQDVSPIMVTVVDYATGGCWTNAGEVKAYALDQLEISGLEVLRGEGMPRSILGIVVQAKRDRDGVCFGRISASVSGLAIWDGKEILATVFSNGTAFLNDQNANIYVLDFVKGFVKEVSQ